MSPSQSVSVESLIRQKCAEHLPVLANETLQLVLPVKFKKSMKDVGRRVAGGGAAPASAAVGGRAKKDASQRKPPASRTLLPVYSVRSFARRANSSNKHEAPTDTKVSATPSCNRFGFALLI